jgi:uncharacterized protein with HEPN domain
VSRTDDQRVLDILDAADLIAGVVKDGRKAWDQDRLRVERLLEITGESANALSDDFRAGYPEVPWRDIIGLRVSSWPIITTARTRTRCGSSLPVRSRA